MSTTVHEDGTVKTSDQKVLQYFVRRHRALCAGEISSTMHMDATKSYADLYKCSVCDAGVMLESDRWGPAPTRITLAPSAAMKKARQESVP